MRVVPEWTVSHGLQWEEWWELLGLSNQLPHGSVQKWMRLLVFRVLRRLYGLALQLLLDG